MNAIDRRRLFSLGATGAGLSLVSSWMPSWLSRWFAQDPQDPKAEDADPIGTARIAQLRDAMQRSRAEGKPLLVLVVPAAENDRWERGSWFGAFLNHGGALAKLELAMTVAACARVSEVATALGTKVKGDPVLLIVDAGESPKVTAVDVELGTIYGQHEDGLEWNERTERDQKRIEAKLVELTDALLDAMHRHGSNVAAVAQSAQAKLDQRQRDALRAWFAGGKRPDDALLVRAAAQVRREAAGLADAPRKQMLDELVEAYDRAIVKQPIAGARWVSSGGCGVDLERETEEEKKDGIGIACGMGSTPPLAKRFLSFYHQPWPKQK